MAVGIIVLVLFGGVLIITNQQSQQAEKAKMVQEEVAMKAKETAAMEEKKVMDKKDATTENVEGKMIKNDSLRYVEYSKMALDQAVDKRRVLYFYASWCPICRPADADFKKNSSKIPEDAIVIRVNYNDPETDQEEKNLAKKYGITYQHTFVQIDKTGKEVTKWNGGNTVELMTNIK